MSDYQCRLEIPKVQGLKDNELTVGRDFFWVCQGPWPADFNIDKVSLNLDPSSSAASNTYALRLIKVEKRSLQEIDLQLLSYKTGNLQWNQLSLTDGQNKIVLPSLQIEVVSVLSQPESGKPPEPFGPMGPISMIIPSWFYTIFILLVTLVLTALAFKMSQFFKLKKLYKNLKKYQSATNPEVEFYKKIRSLEKMNDKNEILRQLELSFKLFLTRYLQIPFLDLSLSLALVEARKKHIHIQVLHSIKTICLEIQDCQKSADKLSDHDLQNMIKKIQREVDFVQDAVGKIPPSLSQEVKNV